MVEANRVGFKARFALRGTLTRIFWSEFWKTTHVEISLWWSIRRSRGMRACIHGYSLLAEGRGRMLNPDQANPMPQPVGEITCGRNQQPSILSHQPNLHPTRTPSWLCIFRRCLDARSFTDECMWGEHVGRTQGCREKFDRSVRLEYDRTIVLY
jgi:hypothetical protein